MRTGSVWSVWLLVALASGCGEESLPKGAGASGKPITVEREADRGLALINRLTADQQRAVDWLHKPFEKVVATKEGIGNPQLIEKVKAEWGKVSFANEKEDSRTGYVILFTTSEGPLLLRLSDEFMPDSVRNFICLARSGFFDGKPIHVSEGLLWLSKEEPPTYGVRGPLLPMPPDGFSLIAPGMGEDLAAGTQFAVLPERPARTRQRVAMLGGQVGHDTIVTIKKLFSKPNQAPVAVISTVEVRSQQTVLFPSSRQGQINLPQLGSQGLPRDLEMYLEMSKQFELKAGPHGNAEQKRVP